MYDQIIYRLAAGTLIFMNLLAFMLMGTDKRRAIKNAWRISEKTLLMVAILGGGIGAFLGMHIFRHKTKHLAFVILLPLAAVLNIVVIVKLYELISM